MDKIETYRIYGLGSVDINYTELARVVADLGISD